MAQHRSSFVRPLLALVAVATTVALLPSGASAADASPKSTEIGVDAKTIRIATVADVDNSIAPGLLQGVVDGVNGAAKMINAQGGVAGRKLVVDFYDSHLNPNDARNGFIKACGQDYAMVGTGTFLISSVDDIVNCKDQAGQVTGVPDIPSVTTGTLEACSPVSFPLNGSQIDCATATSTPQRYQGQIGDTKYYLRKYGPRHGTELLSNDSKATQRSASVLGLLAANAGVKLRDTVAVSSRDPQSAYTSVVQAMKTNGDNYNLEGSPVNSVISMRQEAQLQGFTDPKFLWACALQCYDKAMTEAGSVVDNTHISMAYLPFEEAKYNKTLGNFVKYVGKDKVNGFAMWGFSATLLFKQAVDSVVKDHGVNGLTRANLVAAIKATHSFDGGGMYGTVDPGNKGTSSCFVIVKVQGGKFVREYPTKPGTMDCKPSNHVWIETDLNSQ